MAYPRNINCYDSEKIIIQVSSDDPDIAHDAEGRFVFTGGGTSGINGILPGNITAAYLTGLMNSKLLDFYLKHVSQVYTGSSYSYGDQFIKLLPIKKPQSNEEMKQDLGSYTGEESDNKENVDTAQEIETKAEKLRTITDLESRINSFPIPQFNKLDREGKIAESFELKHTTERRYSNLNIDLSESNEYEIKLGKDDYIREARLDSEIKREFIIEALDGERFTSGEQITLSIPKSDADARKVIELWEDQKARLADEPTVEELEAEINDCVFSLYGTEDENREVVETFLTRF
jgi:vacuolar-type H+-ATPase subunit I/STV1